MHIIDSQKGLEKSNARENFLWITESVPDVKHKETPLLILARPTIF